MPKTPAATRGPASRQLDPLPPREELQQDRGGEEAHARAEERRQLTVAEADRDLVRAAEKHDQEENGEHDRSMPSHGGRAYGPAAGPGPPHSVHTVFKLRRHRPA